MGDIVVEPSEMEKADLVRGETYVGKVDRISNSGNGVINLKSGHVVVAPITSDAVGEEITFKYSKWNQNPNLSAEYLPDQAKNRKGKTSSSGEKLSDPDNKNKLLK